MDAGVPVASCTCGKTWVTSSIGLVGIASMREMVKHWEDGHRLVPTNQGMACIEPTARLYARNRAKFDALALAKAETP